MTGLNYRKMYNNVRLLTSAHHRWRPIFLLSANIKTPRRCGRTKERGTLASKHTEHYGLNQWEASDQVLHSDFNEDNAKLEAALAGKLGHIQIIRSTTLKSDGYRIVLDLTGINWENWALAGFSFARNFLTSHEPRTLCCEFGTASKQHTVFQMDAAPFTALFLPRHDKNCMVEGFYLSKISSAPVFLNCTFSEVETLTVRYSTSMHHLNAGVDITLWGIG